MIAVHFLAGLLMELDGGFHIFKGFLIAS